MSLWRQLARGVRGLTRPASVDEDIDDEVSDYFERTIAAHVARGMSPEAARRAARLELGTATGLREEVRSYGWENIVSTALADLRYGWRRLRATPGYTAITVLTLAIGTGGATAIVSAVNPILFEPLPYPEAGRVVSVLELRADAVGTRTDGTFAMYRRFLDRARALESIAVFKPWNPTVTGADQPERFAGQRVSADYFRALGVSPMVGRNFEASDDRLHAPRVAILSEALWRRRFGGDPAIVGHEITLDDTLVTVIGVMAGTFDNVLAPEAELWAPLQYDASLPPHGREWGHHLRTIGRLRRGVRLDEAAKEINTVGRALLAEQHPETYDPNTQFTVVPLQSELTRSVKPALLVILGGVTLVLVIACANVTNLLLARGVQRRDEFALRTALGAGRGRLTRQLLTESLLLAALGGAAGMLVAAIAVRALVALTPPGLPRAGAIVVNGAMFAFGFGMTTIVGLAVGLIPALQAARDDRRDGLLRHGTRQTSPRGRARRSLVVLEVALALVLLVSSGLLLRSMEQLFAVPVGFDASGLLTMQVQIVGHRFDGAAATNRFFGQALDAVRRVPGVTSAGFTAQLPMSGDRDEYGAWFAATPTQDAETYGAFRYAVSPGYVEAMRIPLRRGRLLDERDAADAPLVVLISESLADSRFHGMDPIGQHLRIGPDGPGPFTIVGVVGDVKQLSLALTDSHAVYLNAAQSWFATNVMSLVVRARGPGGPGNPGGDIATLAPSIRQAIWSVDKDQPVVRIATMDRLLADSAGERRFALMLFEAFGLAALVLAAAGIYGVLAGSVAERTREIGVRSALGATRSNIVGLVARQGMTLTLPGIGIGLAGAVAASQAIAAMLFGVSRLDPITYLAVIALMGGVAAIACSVPAWRAARVDPAVTLRAE
jgi:putative ABC transport system permease protein